MYEVGQSPWLIHKNALVVRSAMRGPPPSTWHRARPSEASVAWGRVGRGTGPSSGAGGRPSRRSETTTLHGGTRPSMGEPRAALLRPVGRAPRTGRKASPNSRAKRAGSGTHRRTARGQPSVGSPKCPQDTPRPELFARSSRTSRRSTWGAKRAPGHGWPSVRTGGGTDCAGSRREVPGTFLPRTPANGHGRGR